MSIRKNRLGDLLVTGGWIESDALSLALAAQRQGGERLGKILVEKGLLGERTFESYLELFQIPLALCFALLLAEALVGERKREKKEAGNGASWEVRAGAPGGEGV